MIPKHLKQLWIEVFGQRWRIIITRVSKDIDGDCNESTRKIRICQKLVGDEITHTMLHELCHAILFELGFKNTTLHPDTNEIISDGIAKALTDLCEIKIKRYTSK